MENDDNFDKTIDHDTNEAQPAAAGPNWTKRLVVGGLLVAAVVGAGAALAQGGGWGHGGPRFGMGFGEKRMERVMNAIDASDEQEDKIWAIVDGVRGDMRPMMRDFRDSRGELVKLLSAPTVDKAAVEKLRAERIVAIDEASRKLSAALIEAAETLTPEQRAKLAEQLDRHGRGGPDGEGQRGQRPDSRG